MKHNTMHRLEARIAEGTSGKRYKISVLSDNMEDSEEYGVRVRQHSHSDNRIYIK